jgi:hypothetical protein
MSLKFLVSNVDSLHGPRVDGQLPHHIPALFDSDIAQVTLGSLFSERRFPNDLAVGIGHIVIVALGTAASEPSYLPGFDALVATARSQLSPA